MVFFLFLLNYTLLVMVRRPFFIKEKTQKLARHTHLTKAYWFNNFLIYLYLRWFEMRPKGLSIYLDDISTTLFPLPPHHTQLCKMPVFILFGLSFLLSGLIRLPRISCVSIFSFLNLFSFFVSFELRLGSPLPFGRLWHFPWFYHKRWSSFW